MFPNDLWIIEPNTDASTQEHGKLHKIVNDSPTSAFIAVEQNARAICVSQDMVTIYLANRDKNSISIIKNNQFTSEIYVGRTPYGICEDHDKNVWVTNYSDNTVSKISKGVVTKTIAVDPGPKGICCDSNGDIYVACFLSSTVTKISSDTKVASIEVGLNPEGITCDSFDNIWTANYGSNTISKITRGIKILDVEVGRAPIAIVADSTGSVFVANYMGNDVTSVSSGNGKIVTTTIPVGAGPTAIAVTQDDSIYVAVGLENCVAKISKNTVIGKIEVCENPSGFGDFTGCAAYNVFNAIPSPGTGETTTIPEGGWYITQLQPDIQKAINAVNANLNSNGTLGMNVEDIVYNPPAESTEETIENVKQALDVIYKGKAPQSVETITLENGNHLTDELNKAEFIIVGKDEASKDVTLTTKLNVIDGEISNLKTNMNNPDLISVGESNLTTKLQDIDSSISKIDGLQSAVDNISTSVNDPAKIMIDGNVNLSQKLQEIDSKQENTEDVVNTIFAEYNKPEYIDMGGGEKLPTTILNINTKIDQNAASIESINQALTTVEGKLNDPSSIMIGETNLTDKLADVDTRISSNTEELSKVDGKISTATADMNDPDKIMLGDKSLTTKLGELDTTDTNTNDRLVDIETTFNRPEFIMVETEKSLKTKLGELDQKDAESSSNIDGLTVRVSDIESKYNKPDQIVVDEEGKTLDVKLSEIDTAMQEDKANLANNYYTKTDIDMKEQASNEKISGLDTRLLEVESKYNKPEEILVAEDKTLAQKVVDIDNALNNRYTKADSDNKFATIETTNGLDTRIQDIESKYNKPDQIIVSEEGEDPVVTLADKLPAIDQNIENVKTNLEENYYSKIDTDAKFETIENVNGVNERLTTVESNYNKPEKIVVEKANVEDGSVPDKTLDVKLSEIDQSFKDASNALDEFKNSIPENYYNKTEIDAKVDEINDNLSTNYYNKTEIDNKDQTLNSKISDNTTRIADIETKYNKPDQIVVDEEGKTLDVKLSEIDASIKADSDNLANNYYTKSDIDSVKTEIDQSISSVSDRVEVIEGVYNNPDNIMIGEDTLSTTVSNINAKIDTKADKTDLDNYYTKVDADGKFTTIETTTEIDTRVQDIESKYNDPEQIIVDEDSAKSLAVKIDELDATIDTKANASDVYSIDVADSTFATISTVNSISDKVSDIESKYNKPNQIVVDEEGKTLDVKLSEMDSTISTKADSETLTNDYYTKVDADGKFATISTLDSTKSELESKTTAVSDRVTTIEGKYNDPDQIMVNEDTLTNNVNTINSSIEDIKANKADKTALDAYTTTEVLAANYSTKVETTAVSDRVTTIEGKYNDPDQIMVDDTSLSETLTSIKSSIETINSDKANASDVYTTETADSIFATKTELSAYDTVESVNSKVANMNKPDHIVIDSEEGTTLTAKLGEVDTTLSNKIDTATVESTYATKVEIADMATKTEVAETYATKSELSSKADSSAISDMLTKTEAGSTYVTKSELDNKVDNSDIADMATKTEVADTYVTKEEFSNTVISVPDIVIASPKTGAQIYEYITEETVKLDSVAFFTSAEASLSENVVFDIETCTVGESSYSKLGESHTLEMATSGNYKKDDVSESDLTINASTRIRINITSIQSDSIPYLAVKLNFKHII